jgi:hypothetical protein
MQRPKPGPCDIDLQIMCGYKESINNLGCSSKRFQTKRNGRNILSPIVDVGLGD